jgi:hypothetical protein
MFKTFRFMLVALLTMVCGSMYAQDEAKTVTWSASSGDALATIYADANITLKWEEGSGDFAPKYSGSNVYFYNGNRVTVAGASSDVTISKIVFTFGQGTVGLGTGTSSTPSTTGITNDSEAMTTTWEGETNSLTFRAAARSGVRYISSIEVTYTGGTTGPVVTAPELAITQANIADTYDMDANGVFVVYYENKGNAAAENAKLALFVDGEENASKTIGTLAIGESSNNWWNAKYNLEGIEPGEHQVYLSLTADNAEAFNTEAKTVTFTKKAPEATFELSAQNVEVQLPVTNIDIPVTVKNTSDVDATNVTLNLWNNGVIATATIDQLPAGESADVIFTIEPLEAGTYEMQALTADNKYGCRINVTVKAAPEEEVVNLAVTDVTGTIELANETSNIRIIVENKGNVDVTDAPVTLMAGDKVLGTATVTVAKGQTGFCYVTVASEGLEEGELNVTATVEAEGDANADDNSFSATLTVNPVPVPEAEFELAVEDVEVEANDATVKVVVNVKNTSEVDADQVEVKLLNGMTQVGESKWVYGLKAGAEQNVTFEFANFDKPGTYELQAVAGKTGEFFNVIVKEPVVNVTITGISGAIDLTQESNYLTVNVENVGTADIADAKVILTVAGEEAELGEATLNVKAGQSTVCSVLVNTEGLEAGTLPVHAAIVAGEETIAEFEKDVTVTDAAPAEPTFTVGVENVEVPFGAESFDINAIVVNSSEVDATNVEVKLMKGTEVLETKTIEALAAGEEATVTFTLNEIGEAGTTVLYYVQVANQVQGEVEVTFAEEVVEEVVDLAIMQVSCSGIDLTLENNYVTVFVENKGNVDMTNVKVVLTVDGEDAELGEGTIAKVKAGENGFCSIAVITEGLEPGTLPIRVEVIAEDDINLDNNVTVKTVEVTGETAAEPTFSVAADNIEVKAGEPANCVIKVTNTSDVDATGVELKVLYGIQTVTTKTIDVPAGETVDVEFSVTAQQLNMILAMLGGRTEVELHAMVGTAECFFTVKVVEEVEPVIDMAIEAIQGATEINLSGENKVTVWYKNNSNVDLENVAIMLSVNDHALEQAVNVAAGKNGYVEFTIPTDIFEPAEDTEAEIVAWVNVEGDTDASNDRLTKTLPIVSGEEEPAAEIAINPISGWEVEAGEQTVNVTVTLFNNGEADAKDVTVELYKSYGDGLCEPQTVDVPAGEENNWKVLTFTFNYTFEAGKSYDFTVFTNFKDANADNQMQQFTLTCPAAVADVAVAKIAPVEATTEEDVVIAATLKNNSDVAAQEVKVGIYTLENMQYQLVGIMQTVEEIAAGEEAAVEFNLGKLAAGNYTYYVRVTTEDNNLDNNMQDVTVKVTEAEEETIDMAIQAVQGPAEINLKGENTYKVWYKNEGNVTVENAEIILLVNDNEAGRQTVTVEPGQNGFVEFTLDVDNLFDPAEDLGLEATLIGFVNVDGDGNVENNKSEMTATVVSKEDVAEPVITIVAEPVEVEFAAESFSVVATLTSDIDAADVEVQLFYNQTIATQTVSFTAGEPVEVTFEGVANPFTKAGEYTMYIIAGKATGEVAVTVKDAPVEEVIDMAITAIQGLSQIDLTKENKVTVWYENKGTVDMENVTIMFSVNDNAQEQVVSCAAGKNGYVEFTIDVADFEPAEDVEAELIAWVNVEGDADNSNDKVTKTVPVVNGVAELSFTVEDVVATINAASFDVNVVVANNGNGEAKDVEVKIYDENGAELGAETVASIAAGAEETVTITINKTYTEVGTFKNQLQVWVKGVEGVKWVAVTVKDTATAIQAIRAQYGENVQIFTLGGQKVNNVQKGQVYIINGKKVTVK